MLQKPRQSWASAGYWWAELCSVVGHFRAVASGSSISLLVFGDGSSIGWLRSLRCLISGVVLIMGVPGDLVVLQLV